MHAHIHTQTKKASSIKQADLRDMIKKAFKSVSVSNIVVSSHTFSPTLSTSSAMKNPLNTGKDTDDPEPADEEDIKAEYSSD
jgi:hypothetical protein